MTITINGSGTITGATTLASTIASPAMTTPTLTTPTMTGAVVSAMGSSVITSGTAVASTSGTSIDFTGIPSWVKRVTVMYNGVSTNGSSNSLIQLGSGSVKTSGYLCSANNSAVGNASYTTGFGSNLANTAGAIIGGSVVFTLFSGNTWVASSASLARTDGAATGVVAGYVTLSGALDRVRVTTETGTDTFDAGSVNILYE